MKNLFSKRDNVISRKTIWKIKADFFMSQDDNNSSRNKLSSVFRKDQSISSQCQNIETYHVKRNQKWKLGIDKFSINP